MKNGIVFSFSKINTPKTPLFVKSNSLFEKVRSKTLPWFRNQTAEIPTKDLSRELSSVTISLSSPRLWRCPGLIDTCVNLASSKWGLLSHTETGPFCWATLWASCFRYHSLPEPGKISLHVNKKVSQLLLVKEEKKSKLATTPLSKVTVWAVFTGLWQKG